MMTLLKGSRGRMRYIPNDWTQNVLSNLTSLKEILLTLITLKLLMILETGFLNPQRLKRNQE